LQKQIGAYGKTRVTLQEYNAIKKPKEKQKYYDANVSNIILCRAAKQYFDEQGYGRGEKKKLPSMNALKQEYATLLSEKRTLGNLKEKRDKMIDWARAKHNVDLILGEHSAPRKIHDRAAR
jgi:hypothetical protein